MIINSKEEYRHIIHYIYETLATREKNLSLLQRLLWLRNLYTNLEFEINLKDSLYNGNKTDNIKIIANIKHREVVLNEF